MMHGCEKSDPAIVAGTGSRVMLPATLTEKIARADSRAGRDRRRIHYREAPECRMRCHRLPRARSA